MKYTFPVMCEGKPHYVTIREEGDDVVVMFTNHDDIKKDALVASMRGTGEPGDCFGVFSEVTGSGGKALSLFLISEAYEGNCKTVSFLLRAGADPNVQTERGFTPLHWAVSMDHEDTAEVLLEAGADPNLKNHYGRGPMEVAKSIPSDRIVDLLKKYGARE